MTIIVLHWTIQWYDAYTHIATKAITAVVLVILEVLAFLIDGSVTMSCRKQQVATRE